ncbi:transglycosylase SLT domain-containing protein [Magnetospirillum sp. 64-120]|uniref:lytic transglycosylase domain-containing protein n=1 Tax=Magnetospirillum sp. 64-120 TaxID=1895778 RepID=UPI0025C35DBF|nr:transglycosylase SLT domain-containing protein [Magnetospirillum sp. 64-120]
MAIPLFAEEPCSRFKMLHWSILSAAVLPSPLTPFVPLAFRIAVAHSDGPGRPTGRHHGALPWTAASTMAGWATRGRRVILSAVVLAVGLSYGGSAMAQSPPVVVPSERIAANGPFAAFTAEATRRFGIPAVWIEAVITVESAGDPHALSPKGAMGLMQLMPATWESMRDRLDLGNDPFNPRANILAGTAYLSDLHARYGSPGFLAAYNAGPVRYEDHLATGRPLPAETQAYLAVLAPMIEGLHTGSATALATGRSWSAAPLFPGRTATADLASSSIHPPDGLSAMLPQAEGLFVHRASSERKP